MVNPLIGIVPAPYRKTAYSIFALIGVVLGAIQVGYGAASAHQPTWLVVALAVYAFVGGGLGLTAASNVQPETETTTSTRAVTP
jgi:hypothetical protein